MKIHTKKAKNASSLKRKTQKSSKNAMINGREVQKNGNIPQFNTENSIPDNSKAFRFELRITNRQQEMIAHAAAILGFKNSTEYVRQFIHENSVKIIKDQAILEIAEQDRKRFIEEIQTPSAPGNILKKAVRNYQKMLVRQ